MSQLPTFDVVVVGNGAIGSAIAFELARRQLRVARVGPQGRPRAASTAAGAMLGCFGEVTRMTVNEPNGRMKLEADIQARRLWPEWDGRLASYSENRTSLVRSGGTTVVLNTIGGAAVDDGNFEAIQSALLEFDEPFEQVDVGDIYGMQPDDLSRPLRAIHIPGENSLDLPSFLSRLDAGLLAEGGKLVDAVAHEVVVDGQSCQGVQLEDGRVLHAPVVVVASGSSSLRLLGSVPEVRRQIPPLFNGYGVSVLLRPNDHSLPDHVIRTPNRAFACGLHTVPRGRALLYVGGTNVVRHTPRTNATIRDLEFLLNCAVYQIDTRLALAEVAVTQVGNRPVSADGFPLIGEVGVGGLWLATGTYRDGVQQSLLIASAVADAIEAGAKLPEVFSRFKPVRPPLQIGNREGIVELAAEELVAVGRETHWTVRPEWPDIVEDYGRRLYADRADSLHDKFTPPPDVLAKLEGGMRAALIEYYGAW